MSANPAVRAAVGISLADSSFVLRFTYGQWEEAFLERMDAPRRRGLAQFVIAEQHVRDGRPDEARKILAQLQRDLPAPGEPVTGDSLLDRQATGWLRDSVHARLQQE